MNWLVKKNFWEKLFREKKTLLEKQREFLWIREELNNKSVICIPFSLNWIEMNDLSIILNKFNWLELNVYNNTIVLNLNYFSIDNLINFIIEVEELTKKNNNKFWIIIKIIWLPALNNKWKSIYDNKMKTFIIKWEDFDLQLKKIKEYLNKVLIRNNIIDLITKVRKKINII